MARLYSGGMTPTPTPVRFSRSKLRSINHLLPSQKDCFEGSASKQEITLGSLSSIRRQIKETTMIVEQGQPRDRKKITEKDFSSQILLLNLLNYTQIGTLKRDRRAAHTRRTRIHFQINHKRKMVFQNIQMPQNEDLYLQKLSTTRGFEPTTFLLNLGIEPQKLILLLHSKMCSIDLHMQKATNLNIIIRLTKSHSTQSTGIGQYGCYMTQ